MKNNSIIITVLVAVIVGALAFYGGMQYQRMQRGAGRFGGAGGFAQFGGGPGGRTGGFGSNGTRPVVGQITSMDDKSVTVKLPDGSSKIVILSTSTAINKQATGSKSDLKSGENILVIGTNNSDGSVTATNIQLNPMMRGMRGQNATPSGQ